MTAFENMFNFFQKVINQHGLTIVLGLFIIFAALYLHFRILDSDEGFYIVAAQNFPEQLPYADYFFTQSPLTIPFFWIFSRLPFGLLESARAGALLLSIGTLLLLFQTAANRWGKSKGVIAAFLLALNFSFIQWGIVAKTYAPSLFFIAAFLYVVERYISTREKKYLALAWLCVGMGGGFRLILGVLALPLLFLMWKEPLRQTIPSSIIGLVAGIIPMALFVLPSIDRFFFDTLQWHTLRESIPLASEISVELGALAGVFVGKAGSLPFPFLGNIILYGFAAWVVFQTIVKKIKMDEFTKVLLLALAALFVAVVLTPYAREQYFVILLPLIVLLGLSAWPSSRKIPCVLVILFLLPTLLLIAKPIFAGSEGLSPNELDSFAHWIQSEVPSSAVLFSHDALFPLLAQREPAPDLSMGRSNYSYSFTMTRENADYYHLQNEQKMTEILSNPLTQGVVVLETFPFDLNMLGFTKKGTLEGYDLYVK